MQRYEIIRLHSLSNTQQQYNKDLFLLCSQGMIALKHVGGNIDDPKIFVKDNQVNRSGRNCAFGRIISRMASSAYSQTNNIY
jgi:hypothetical protein